VPEHGPTVARVLRVRHGAGDARDFDDQVVWLVRHLELGRSQAVCGISLL